MFDRTISFYFHYNDLTSLSVYKLNRSISYTFPTFCQQQPYSYMSDIFYFFFLLTNIISFIPLFQVRNATAVFIINLSVSDLSFCCFNLPLAASTFWYRSWIHGQLLCRLFPLVRYGLLAVSLFTILAITINRYIMIGHPSLYPK